MEVSWRSRWTDKTMVKSPNPMVNDVWLMGHPWLIGYEIPWLMIWLAGYEWLMKIGYRK
jgi:hypothetical protein